MNVPAYGSEPRKPKTKWIVASAIAVLVFACGLVGLFAFVIGPKLFPYMHGGAFEFPAEVEIAKSSGPSKSMSEMLTLAQEEAKKVDGNAVLNYVLAANPGYTTGVTYSGPLTGSIDVRFEFRRPNGKSIDVEFEDADPRGTLDVNVDNYGSNDDYSIQRYKDAQDREPDLINTLKALKLSPRDAVEKTWEDSREYARKNGISEDHVLPLITLELMKVGNSKWDVDYWYKESRSTISLSDAFDLSGGIVYYTVDGVTGEITKAEYQTVSPTSTTAP